MVHNQILTQEQREQRQRQRRELQLMENELNAMRRRHDQRIAEVSSQVKVPVDYHLHLPSLQLPQTP